MAEQRIRLLDETTINQIAAGEVIENPASVVKELVENALDSGAHCISVETKGGGRGLIRVSDDGCGMNSEDLILALERHATSKLIKLQDLDSLSTLGFRGEALPSIASISKLLIHSSVDQGHQLYSEGGKILKVNSLSRRQGTTVEVKSLFFNVPVRKRFQKSIGWDTAEIHKVLTKVALCHQKVVFTWVSDGIEKFNLSAEVSLEERIQTLLGEEFSQSMLSVEHQKDSFHLSGFCSCPSFHRPNRTGQYLFINGRAVTSSFVSRKILEGYGTRLSTHRYPLFVLHLQLPSSLIDVNVHPQKKEIRLRDEEYVGTFLVEAIEKCFVSKPAQAASISPEFVASESFASYTTSSFFEKEKTPSLLPPCRSVLAKVGHYLFVEDPEGILVVDGAAARLRVHYEQLIHNPEKKASQHLLIPIQMEVAGAEKALLLSHLSLFDEVGFSIRPFGENSFIVDAIPPFFERDEVSHFVHAFLEEGNIPKEKRIVRALRKIGSLHLKEVGEVLVEKLFQCREPDYTPEGKPTYYLLTEKELSQKFR